MANSTNNSKKKLSKQSQRTFKFYGVDIPFYKDCPECGAKNSCPFRQYTHAARCPKCQKKKDKIDIKKAKHRPNSGPMFKKYKEPVAFGHDKITGQPIAIDKKGKRFDPSETRYDLTGKDPKGWKATGKQ